jgi:hypothetical protein
MKTFSENSAKIAKSTRPYEVIFAYSTGSHAQGELLSTHSSYELAEKAAARSGYSTFLAIRDSRDYA